MINEFEEYVNNIKKEINSNLDNYINQLSLKRVKNSFSCPNKSFHKHGDTNPSASVRLNGSSPFWNCFTCGAAGDVFSLAHYTEGLPNKGPEFISKTIPTLASKFGIEWNPESVMTDAMKEIRSMYYANELVAAQAVANLKRMFTENTDHPVVKYITERHFNVNDIEEYELGYIELADAISILNRANIPLNIAKELGIANNLQSAQDMFNEHTLVFVLRNHNNNVVAFASRDINYVKGKGAKYVNTRTNRIFQKSEFLYGLNKAKEPALEDGTINVYEGYTDVIASHKAGIKNAVAVCGVAFSEDHLILIGKIGIKNINFTLDGDEAGLNATFRTIEKLFSSNKMVTPFIRTIPNGQDPYDVLIKEGGAEEFLAIEKDNIVRFKIKTIFKKSLTDEMADVDIHVEEFFRWLIQYEPNVIRQTKCLELLSEYTKITVDDLRNQLNYQSKLASEETTRKADVVWHEMVRAGRSSIIKERLSALDIARNDLNTLLSDSTEIGDLKKTQIEAIDEIDKFYKESKITQIKTGWKDFDNNIMIPKDASLTVIGAYPNMGKSILTRNMTLNFIKENPDIGVIYFSLDDPMKATVPAFLANIADVPINFIRYQNTIPSEHRANILSKIEGGINTLKNLVNTNRLALFDQGTVCSMSEIETMTNIWGEKMVKDGKKPVVFVDSMHSISMDNKIDRRLEVMENIRSLRKITNTCLFPVITVGELRKGNSKIGKEYKRPTLRDLSETGDIEYRVTVGIILENELKDKGSNETAKQWKKKDPYSSAIFTLPIVSLHVDKNKEGFFQGELNYKTDPILSKMTEMTKTEVDGLYANNNCKSDNETVNKIGMEQKTKIASKVSADDDDDDDSDSTSDWG